MAAHPNLSHMVANMQSFKKNLILYGQKVQRVYEQRHEQCG